jgi:nicotinate-nucleotide pyrophosphorylase (carboxylating)
MIDQHLNTLIRLAITEDIGDGDHSSFCCFSSERTGKGTIIAKQDGILCGIQIASAVASLIDTGLEVNAFCADGDKINYGTKILGIQGPSASILQAERTILNFMQRLSGISTATRIYADEIEGTGAKLLDTRKTTPGFRALEKYAVKVGGGHNHRMGLYDMIMIKDNHIDYAGGVKQAMDNAVNYLAKLGKSLPIEVEARSMAEIEQILQHGAAFRILIDNFTPDKLKEAVVLINRQLETEASGGISLQTIRSYAQSGVDYISVGALTHQIKSLDMSLKAYL